MTAKPFRGFTLVEVLVVIVITGIVAAIAIPKFSATKEKALLATMKADLRNLALQQELYEAEHVAYTTAFPPSQFSATAGVTGPTIAVTRDGWTAVVGHRAATSMCAMFVGSTSVAPATEEHSPRCAPATNPDIEADSSVMISGDTVANPGGRD